MNLKISIFAGFAICFCSCGFNADSKFAVTGIDDVTKIELIENENKVLLSKAEDGNWMVSSFKANMRNVANLKKIIENIEVQYPLPKIHENQYPLQKISEGVQIKIYKGKRTVKNYYLLFTDSIGTIGLVKGSSKPRIVDFSQQDIDMEEYIVVEPAFWENNLAFSIKSEEIKSVKTENMSNPDNSFILKKHNDGIVLCDLNDNVLQYNTTKVNRYLSYFGKVSFENNLNIGDVEKQKIVSTNPLYILTIETTEYNLTCRIYPINDNGVDDYNNPLIYNRDFFYLFIPEKELFAKAKWTEFDVLLEEIGFLTN